MNVNFFLKDRKKTNTAINCIIRYRGERFKLATGVSVNPDIWNGNRADEKAGGTDAEVVNIRLDRFEAEVKQVFEPHRLNKTTPTLKELRQAMRPQPATRNPQPATIYFLPFFKSYYENAPYKQITVKKYKTTYNWLKKYERHTGQQFSFDDINLHFYTHFKKWIFIHPENYSLNYFGSLIKNIKRVMDEAGPDNLNLHTNTEYRHKKFKVTAEDADTIYLTTDELFKIHHFTATPENITEVCADPRLSNRQQKAAALNLAKNKFLIGAFTALRVSDFNRLREVNLQNGTIRIKPKKGTRKNEDVIIPIHPVVREILSAGFDIETPMSEQRLNDHIKEVCQLAGITQPVTTARTEGGHVTERTLPKYAMVTTHTARRSGATNMFKAGIPAISIMKITGHTTEKSFMKYIKITQEENAELLKKHPFFMFRPI